MKTFLTSLFAILLPLVSTAAAINCNGYIGAHTNEGEIVFENKIFEHALEANKKISLFAFKTGEVVAPKDMTEDLYAKIDENTVVLTIRLKDNRIHTSINKAKDESISEFAYNMSYDDKKSNLIAYNYYLTCNEN